MKKAKSISGPVRPNWWCAITIADESGALTQLVALLRSDKPLAGADREMLAELLSRHKLKDLRGGKRRSPYADLPDEQVSVITAALEFEEQGPRCGELKHDALVRLADEYKCDWRQIENWLKRSGTVYGDYGHLIYRERDDLP